MTERYGDGWSLVSRTDSVSFMLLDTDTGILHPISWKEAPSVLGRLMRLAPGPGRAV